MNTISFSIKNYHAIKEANIDIDGITVLAGINGSGKSTVSRWLYYLTNGMNEFEHIQRGYFVNALAREITKLVRLFRLNPIGSRYENYRDNILRFREEEVYDENKLANLFIGFVLQAENDLKKYIEDITPEKERLVPYYLLDENREKGRSLSEVVDLYISNCYALLQDNIEALHKTLSSRSLDDLEDIIQNEYEQYSGMPKEIDLKEDGFPLLGESAFALPITLRRTVYVDSPMVLSDMNDGYRGLWGRFKRLLYNPNKGVAAQGEKLQAGIQRIIGGKVKMEEDDIGFIQELHYVANDGVDIRIEETATGVKSFAYMSRLLENGWLDKETLLLIDEPEAHLHPQWVVEFARLLVLIHKELGTSIMIASHNPDMVAAIQSIAMKEEVLNRTRFYLAEKERGSMIYNFVDKGMEIGDIFESFNIALSRIEQYGTALM